MRVPFFSSAMAGATVLSLVFCATPLRSQTESNRGNYKLAQKYSSEFLRQFSYSTSIRPEWIGESNRFWYLFRTSEGTRYWLVDAEARTKLPLFDHDIVAGAITEATEKAVRATDLKITGVKFADSGSTFRFVAGGFQFEYDRTTHDVKKLGKAPTTNRRGNQAPGAGRGGSRNLTREQIEQLRQRGRQNTGRREGGREGETSGRGRGRNADAGRSYSPDRSAYVYAKDHNLFIVEGSPLPVAPEKKIATASLDPESASETEDAGQLQENKLDGEKNLNGDLVDTTSGAKTKVATAAVADKKTKKVDTPKTPAAPKFKYDEKSALQLSKDGIADYSFGGASRAATTSNTRGRNQVERGTRTGRGTETRRRGRPSGGSRITWSKDSRSFFTTRRDGRDLPDLFLVNSLADPRPTLRTYKYPMPGEDRVRTSELHYFHRDQKKLVRVQPKWKDESYQHVAWDEASSKLRFMRRDRLLRTVEYCSLDPQSGKIEVLFREGSKDGYLKVQGLRFLKEKKQAIWWSERTGWGHYYLYGNDGKLANAITRGAFRASSIVSLDEAAGVLYFRGNGREEGENVYYEHLYRVRLDGTGLTLLDPGDATHRSSLSPSKRFVVDNWSRVDQAPGSALRDAEGNLIMNLEECDLSKLREVGWQMPETFSVKAADGVTDLYGNMWKPFDFDPAKTYPIIAHVYPGPQQEGVTHTFSAVNSRQQLAQIGFIVIQVGHRGGTPTRSRAYANYGYYNMRDFGLADKKAAIEQLAMRHSYIDVDRVGIYGHSGGGFMTGAALMQKPYNEFFKVGVASAGNHDNNIYNNSWSERYHGLKEVAIEAKAKEDKAKEDKAKEDKAKEDNSKENTTNEDKVKTGQSKTEQTGSTKTKTTMRNGKKRRAGWRERLADKKSQSTEAEKEKKTKFEIRVPTNAELAANLKGHLLLVHGEIDNNVHPANTMRLVDALIKANKRFDMLIIPGASHSFGKANGYFTYRMWDYFAQHLLGDRHRDADIKARLP